MINLNNKIILYVETNFLMSIATGRDAQAISLLENKPPLLDIAIPSICCMEALSALEDEQKRRNRLDNEINLQISQLERDKTSLYAQSLLANLQESIIANKRLSNEIQARLFTAFDRIATKAEIIELTADVLKESINANFITREPTDNLIFHCIIAHSRWHPTNIKVFLSGNAKEFDLPEIRDVLRNNGIVKYFRNTENFQGWLNNQVNNFENI